MNRPLAPLLAAALWLTGCDDYQQNLVLAPVGPRPVQPASTGTQGSLVVFLAFETDPNLDPEYARHSRYKIFAEDGKLLQVVRNDSGIHYQGPVSVELAPGSYRVVARANGYGPVTMPIVIAANQVTTLHLEGDGSSPDQASLTPANSVRLPDGRRVGWRAAPANPTQP